MPNKLKVAQYRFGELKLAESFKMSSVSNLAKKLADQHLQKTEEGMRSARKSRSSSRSSRTSARKTEGLAAVPRWWWLAESNQTVRDTSRRTRRAGA